MKRYLLTPGPTPLPPFVQEALSRPILHHRTGQFIKIFKNAVEGLQYIFQTKEPVAVVASSGTGAMEAAVANLVSEGDKAIVVRGGKFGERWAEIAAAYGCEVINIDVEWGSAVELSVVEGALKAHPDAKALFITHCETSTAVETDVEIIAKLTQKTDTLLVVDAISSLGVSPLYFDDWGVDVVVSGSQKGLMLPPGLGFVAMSKRAQERMAKTSSPRYYLDLRKYFKLLSADKPDTPFTPAIGIIVALNEVVSYYKENGIKNIWSRYERLAKGTRKGLEHMGLTLFSKSPSNGVTAALVPDGVDGAKVVKTLRDEYGISIAGGQAKLKGKIVRIAHMGYIEGFDLAIGLTGLSVVLKKMGWEPKPGFVDAAAEIWFE